MRIQPVTAAARKLARAQEGATVVEYGLMLAAIALICLAAISSIGMSIAAFFSQVTLAF